MLSHNNTVLLGIVLLLSCSDSIERSTTARVLGEQQNSSNNNDSVAAGDNSVAAFAEHLLPALQSCASCHGQQQAPLFAVSDAAAAHRAVMDGPKVDFQDIPNSRLVRRLTEDNHNCVSDCQAEGKALIAAITAWKNAIQGNAAQAVVTPALDPTDSHSLHYEIGDLVDSSYNKVDIKLEMVIEPLKSGGGYTLQDLQISTQYPVYLAGIKPLINGTWDALNASLNRVGCAARPPRSTLLENTTVQVDDMEAAHQLSFSFVTLRAASPADPDCDTRSGQDARDQASISAEKKNTYKQKMGEHFRRYCSCHPDYATNVSLAWKNRVDMTNRINGIGRIMPPTTHAAQMSDNIKQAMLDWLSD